MAKITNPLTNTQVKQAKDKRAETRALISKGIDSKTHKEELHHQKKP